MVGLNIFCVFPQPVSRGICCYWKYSHCFAGDSSEWRQKPSRCVLLLCGEVSATRQLSKRWGALPLFYESLEAPPHLRASEPVPPPRSRALARRARGGRLELCVVPPLRRRAGIRRRWTPKRCGALDGCWETFCFVAYCGLVVEIQIHLTARIKILAPLPSMSTKLG